MDTKPVPITNPDFHENYRRLKLRWPKVVDSKNLLKMALHKEWLKFAKKLASTHQDLLARMKQENRAELDTGYKMLVKAVKEGHKKTREVKIPIQVALKTKRVKPTRLGAIRCALEDRYVKVSN